jgi:hypothetical protein
MGEYLGVQVYGVICITLWGIFMSAFFFGLFSYFGVLRYHPVLEMVGAHRLKMGEISEKWLKEIRSIKKEKAQEDIEANKDGEVVDFDAQIDEHQRMNGQGERRPTNVPLVKKTAKVAAESEATVN